MSWICKDCRKHKYKKCDFLTNKNCFKLEYKKANKPKDINILDYTIIYALKDCLERYSEKRTN